MKTSLTEELNRMFSQNTLAETEYYQLSLFADEDGKYRYSYQTNWCDLDEDNRRIEIREPSTMNIGKSIEIYKSIGEPLLIVNDKKDFFLFTHVFGGNALIPKKLCIKYLSHIYKPQKVVNTYDRGFINAQEVEEEGGFKRAANPKLRMRIFKRDNFRCRICGASPSNNEHVELHLHHIILYSLGGLTDENNLITLCHTCHKGLDPHLDYSLFDLIGVDFLFTPKSEKESYLKRIQRNIHFGTKRLRESKEL